MKRILVMAVSVLLVVTLAIGGTVAYLTDTENETNTFEVGKVDIVQIEQERPEGTDGEQTGDYNVDLGNFTDDRRLLPSYDFKKDADGNLVIPKNDAGLWSESRLGDIDKIVTVENKGDEAAYIRTIFAFEDTEGVDAFIHKNYNSNEAVGTWEAIGGTATIEGVPYKIYVFTYKEALAAPVDGQRSISAPSLKQIAMDASVGNETIEAIEAIDSKYTVLVATQAVQASNMGNSETAETSIAKAALNEAFYVIDADKNHPWAENAAGGEPGSDAGKEMYASVTTASEMQLALDMANEANRSITINMAADITDDVTITQKAGVNVTINGVNNKFNGVMTVFGNGKDASRKETLTIKNIAFVAKDGADSCIVSPDRSVNNKYSYAHNVTIDNCTFTDPTGDLDCAAVRTSDGGDTNWTIRDCEVDNTMHSFVQVQNIEDNFFIEGCTVESKNGANFNSTTKLEMSGCTFDVKGYALRFGVNSGSNPDATKTFNISDSTLKSQCNDGDAVIILRTSAGNANTTMNLTNTSVTGTTQISGNNGATITGLN